MADLAGLPRQKLYDVMAVDFGVQSLMSSTPPETLKAAKENGWADRMVPEVVCYFEGLFGGGK